jgi:hypothetical protein
MDRAASATALAVATLRAAHQLLDSPPHILEDPVVLRLSSRRSSTAFGRIRSASRHRRCGGFFSTSSRAAGTPRIGWPRPSPEGPANASSSARDSTHSHIGSPAWAAPLRIFTFTAPKAPDESDEMAERTAAAGEPWLTRIEPEALEQRLRAHGLSTVTFLTSRVVSALRRAPA